MLMRQVYRNAKGAPCRERVKRFVIRPLRSEKRKQARFQNHKQTGQVVGMQLRRERIYHQDEAAGPEGLP